MMLRVKLLGAGQASLNNVPLDGFPSQQVHMLLGYILLNSHQVHLRDHLATLFWGDHDTQTSRKYLRNSLWKLRCIFEELGACLDDFLLVTDTSVAVIGDSPIWLDVDVFETAVTNCQDVRGQDMTAEQAYDLEQAVALYQNDLLMGNYSDWCLYERERLSLLYTSSLIKLMFFNEINGNYERGLMYAGKVLERDNTREAVHVEMMRLYWLSGNRKAALAQYRRCVQVLREEMGIPPLKETTRVYQQMLQNHYEPFAISPQQKAADMHNLQEMAQRSLLKLQYLQNMLEETRVDLLAIEQRIHAETVKTDI